MANMCLFFVIFSAIIFCVRRSFFRRKTKFKIFPAISRGRSEYCYVTKIKFLFILLGYKMPNLSTLVSNAVYCYNNIKSKPNTKLIVLCSIIYIYINVKKILLIKNNQVAGIDLTFTTSFFAVSKNRRLLEQLLILFN